MEIEGDQRLWPCCLLSTSSATNEMLLNGRQLSLNQEEAVLLADEMVSMSVS